MEFIAIFSTVTSLIVQMVKAIIKGRLPDEVYPVVALVVGVAISLAFKDTAMTGIIIGLTSMGIYSGVKNVSSGYAKLTENK